MENIIGFINAIAGLLVAFTAFAVKFVEVTKSVKETSLPKKIKKQLVIDNEIISKIEYLKEFLVADRIQIYDFHNGGHYANGRSALKVSCTYESVRAGIKSYQSELQAIPLTCIPKFTQKLLDDSELLINNIEEIKESMPLTYVLKKNQEVRSFYDIIINNEKGEPIGFLGIQYNKLNSINYNTEQHNQILKVKYFVEEKLSKFSK